MASSSIQCMTKTYDVFVSFHGDDIRLNFRDHLFGAFRRKGISVFRDDTMITKGESLEPELVRAIEGSLVYVVVFSKNFASSTWCLRELEMILECVRDSRKPVFPVFYDVDPSEVRRQNVGNYAEAFAKHEERFKQKLDMVQNWRDALTQAADISGWDMHEKPQYEETENMVKEIMNILCHNFPSLPKDVVGMHSPIKEVENHLLLDSVDDVHVLGISGLGGIGKSTLVSILYGTISHQFDACVFVDDVSQIYRHVGPIGVLRQILCQILDEQPLQICNLYDATKLIRSRLSRVKAFIILDNVDQGGQLEKLAIDREWLGAGSRVIIVSRDEHILREYGVDVIYKVPLLNHDDSFQLFCRKAFKRDSNYIMGDVMMSDYEWLANSILEYANGLPLAIKVLGSFLFGRDISEWKSALVRLRESPNNDIMDVLRISFDGLQEMEKEIFLDIACFFVGKTVSTVKHILNSCGFQPVIGLRVLIDKSLITIDSKDGYSRPTVGMHKLLKKLGRQIVNDISEKNARRGSRLYKNEMWGNVLRENMEKSVEAIVLKHELRNIEGEISIGETLSKMSRLRLLILKEANSLGSLDHLSKELRYVQVPEYPLEYLPSSFHPNHLVDLRLTSSKIKQLWKGKKYLPNLRFLDLSHSKDLIMMPDFSEFPNIEWLNLEGCTKLEHLGSPNDVPRKLESLYMEDCKNLSSIPNGIFGLSSLVTLVIPRCSKLGKNLNIIPGFKSTIGFPFHSLCELDVSFCNFGKIPDAIGCLHLLERMNLGGNRFETLPSLEKLSKLEYLNMEHCKYLKSLPKLPSPATSERDLPIFPKDKYRRGRGMYIFNCPVLGQRERCSNMVSSWMIQFIRVANQQSSTPFVYLDTIIPGSEIPRWFKYQTSGSSRLCPDPSSVMEDNDIIGVAYCAVFPVVPSNRKESLELITRFCQVDYGEFGFNVESSVILDSDLIMVQSTHMWLIYFPMQSFLDSVSSVNLDDLVIDTNMSLNPSVKVMRHGYNWVFKKDLQIMHDRKSLAQEHNFLAI